MIEVVEVLPDAAPAERENDVRISDGRKHYMSMHFVSTPVAGHHKPPWYGMGQYLQVTVVVNITAGAVLGITGEVVCDVVVPCSARRRFEGRTKLSEKERLQNHPAHRIMPLAPAYCFPCHSAPTPNTTFRPDPLAMPTRATEPHPSEI